MSTKNNKIILLDEIRKDFTDGVKNYLEEGYSICINTMGASQSWIADIDLLKGNDIVRIYLTRRIAEKPIEYLSTYNLIVEKFKKPKDFGLDAKKAGMDSNLDYIIDVLKKDIEGGLSHIDALEKFIDYWLGKDSYYKDYSLEYLTNEKGEVRVISLAILS